MSAPRKPSVRARLAKAGLDPDSALPAMIEAGVPDLVWTWHKPQSVWRAQSILGEYEVDTHGSWTRTKCETIGKVHDGGKAAANAHNRATLMAALGMGVE